MAHGRRAVPDTLSSAMTLADLTGTEPEALPYPRAGPSYVVGRASVNGGGVAEETHHRALFNRRNAHPTPSPTVLSSSQAAGRRWFPAALADYDYETEEQRHLRLMDRQRRLLGPEIDTALFYQYTQRYHRPSPTKQPRRLLGCARGDPRNELVSPWRDDGVIIPGFEASRHPPNLEGGRRCLQSRQSFDDAEASLKAAARWPNPAIPSPSESGSEPVAKRSKVPDRGAPANDAVDGEVTIEEALRASRTREANRLAVRQHRERKKDKVNVLTEENAQLRERVSELEGEVERLQRGVPALDLDERTELEKLRNMRHQIADLVKK